MIGVGQNKGALHSQTIVGYVCVSWSTVERGILPLSWADGKDSGENASRKTQSDDSRNPRKPAFILLVTLLKHRLVFFWLISSSSMAPLAGSLEQQSRDDSTIIC